LEKKFKECEKGDDITPFDGSSSPVRHAELAAPDTPLVALEDSHQPEIFGPQLGRLVQAAGRHKLVTG